MTEDVNLKSGSTDEIFQKTFQMFFQYVSNIVGHRKAHVMAEQSYQTIFNYFRNLSTFELEDNSQLKVTKSELTDKEILAFSVWMQQLLKELRDLMIGLGKINPKDITKEIEKPLKELGFYEFFEQAKELSY